ncbi:uncharacterized protein EAF01_006176 [Botrytis porri]|uniref:uncharacterized protein n=1 Tax=Botrytis porri TaxID=87229 RepID=UPI0019024521|nr:uncharacterized protein EAF01_006176 [Botrytis porri]KAF7905655.1 hypothetical protein EAF01_006176 [Botrytis porri]
MWWHWLEPWKMIRLPIQIEGFSENLDSMCDLCLVLVKGVRCLKAFGPGNKTCRENYPFYPRPSVLYISPDLVSELEKTYERLDPIGYQQYLALIVVPGKGHETPAKECDEKLVDRTGETNDKPIAPHHPHSKAPPQYTPSLASVKTAVNDTTSTNPEKNTGNKIHYETWTLHHVPAHKEQNWWTWLWCDLKLWPGRPEYIMKEWSSSSDILHPAEILGIRQRFQDVTRRKMNGCGMRMEIKAGEDVEGRI